MTWLDILGQIFDVCIVPILSVLVTALVKFIQQKIDEAKKKSDSDLTVKYLEMLETTILDCLQSTNQTYVDALKEEGLFDEEAQKEALQRTKDAVWGILSEDAITYLTAFIGDLDSFIEHKIEANIKMQKAN